MVFWIKAAEGNFPGFIDDKDRPLAGADERTGFAQHAVASAHFSVRPEIAAQGKIKGTDFTLPGRRIHNVIHADGHDFRFTLQKTLALHLINHHLLCTRRLPIQRIESQNQPLFASMLGKAKDFLDASDQDRDLEIRSRITRLQQRNHLIILFIFISTGNDSRFRRDPARDFLPHLTASGYLIFAGRQFHQAEWATAVKFLGADAHFRAKSKLSAVGKPG
jgi:hypothetical protein